LKIFKVAVLGSEEFDDWAMFSDKLSYYLCYRTDIEFIIKGGRSSVDSFTKRYAEENKHPLSTIGRNTDAFGKMAALRQINQIVESCDGIVFFGVKNDRDVGSIVKLCKSMSKPYRHVIDTNNR
jgi:hypothetical protein